MALKDFVPPVFVKLFKTIIFEKKVKEYKDYHESLQNCKTMNTYENQELCQMIGDKTVSYRALLQERPYTIKSSNSFLALAISRHLSNLPDKISVLDFGGACGAHYFETRPLFDKKIKFDWNVVETAGMLNSAQSHCLESDELHFFENIEDVNKNIDLIHSSGALQSVPEWALFLKKMKQMNSCQMLFNRMMFNENDRTFVTIQKSLMSDNGHGKMPEKYNDRIMEYPHTTISLKAFLEEVEKDYTLEWIFEESSGSYKINGEKIIW
jgi:putative methyltransferase (TIGR04325 family)